MPDRQPPRDVAGVATVDQPVGATEETELTALELNSHEIQAVALGPEPVALKRAQLERMRTELVARIEAGHHDLEPLRDEIDATLAGLT